MKTVVALLAPIAHATTSAPQSFDCAMRKLAYKYGKQLLPRQGAFESLYYALNLNDESCLGELEGAVSLRASELPEGAIYVDPLHGDDSNLGTEVSPLQSIQKGVQAASSEGTLVLRGGTFYLKSTLELGPQHSGLTIMAYPGELPVLSGGVVLDADWEPADVFAEEEWEVDDSTTVVWGEKPDDTKIRDFGKQPDAISCQSACSADERCSSYTWHSPDLGAKWANLCWGRLDHEWPARSQQGHTSGRPKLATKIYKANVKGQVSEVAGLQLDGQRATRARYPNLPRGIEVTEPKSARISGNAAVWTPPNFNKYGPVTYYEDDTDNHTRWDFPTNWYQHYMIGINGLCSVYDPPVGYWCSEHTKGGGAFAFRTPSGLTPNSGVLPNAPYADVSEMIVNVWRPKRWANWMFTVGDYDTSTNNFTFGEGGNQGARGNDVGGDWFVENVLEELDHPGEFFFDKRTSNLFLYYNGTGSPPKDMEVVVPQLRTLVNISGTQWNPVRNLRISGLTFKAARYTYMDPHGVPSAGDWALDRQGAVFLQGTEGVTVSDSIFERLDGNAVMISGYNRNATVQDSDFSFLGGNAIVGWGYTNETENSGFPYYTPNTNFPEAGVDGTDGNHPRYSKILRNSAREVGLYEKQSSFYMQAKTAETTISGNVFFNGPRAGINFNDGFGGGDDVSHNLVFSTCRESGDHGPLNSWDRQPYLTTVRTGEPSMTMAWRQIHHNFFIDNYSPQEGVDNDDGSEYYHTHDNFLVYGGQGQKADFGGHDNRHQDNIYAYVGRALSTKTHASPLEGHENWFTGNTVFMTGTDVGSPQCDGTGANIMHDNKYYTPNGTVTECGQDLQSWQAQGHDAGSIVGTLPADNVIVGLAMEKLGIRKSHSAAVFV